MKVKNIKIPIDEISELCQRWHIRKLSLFGSVLRDDFTSDSDIDILVDFETGFTPGFFKLHQIQEELSELFERRTIDLVTIKSLNHRIRDRVLETAEVCYIGKG
ncbi:nucleotidyltransferase family protein [Pannus brasiliensis CCIBt3594]|uniref:Nucleotidyltransferase family protein n=1 Tax=Pannus brasiliensis CCIBt3594 TaxID=1427578 RepID=A0AAW9QYT1_9CHRO